MGQTIAIYLSRQAAPHAKEIRQAILSKNVFVVCNQGGGDKSPTITNEQIEERNKDVHIKWKENSKKTKLKTLNK